MRGRNARHHRIGHAGLAQRLDFLAAAAEHEGVAALQAYRALARFRGLDQQAIDRLLADAGLSDATADRNARRIATRAVENFGRHQFVVEHDVGVLQRAQCFHRQQIRITRARADQRHPAFGRTMRTRKRREVRDIVQRLLGLGVTSGKHQRADRTVDHALPETAAQRHLGDACH